MLYLTNLDDGGRKRYFGMLSYDEFKKYLRQGFPDDQKKQFLWSMGKNFDKTNKGAIIAHVKEHNYGIPDGDPVLLAWDICVDRKIFEKFKKKNKIVEYLKGKKYSELTDEDHNWLEQYRKQYQKGGFSLMFDDLIHMSCDPEENTENSTEDKTSLDKKGISDEIELLRRERDELEEKLKKEKQDNTKQLYTLKTKHQNETEKLKTALEEEKAKNKIENITTSLTKTLNRKIEKSDTFEDIYEELTAMENEYVNGNDYSGLQKVLAAKFAIAKHLGETDR